MDTAFLIGLVIAFTEVVKRAFGITKRFIPLVSIVVSAFIFMVYSKTTYTPFNWDMFTMILIVGFTAGGVYSGVKNTLGN